MPRIYDIDNVEPVTMVRYPVAQGLTEGREGRGITRLKSKVGWPRAKKGWTTAGNPTQRIVEFTSSGHVIVWLDEPSDYGDDYRAVEAAEAPGWASAAGSALVELERLPEDWDSYGGVPVRRGSPLAALSFLG